MEVETIQLSLRDGWMISRPLTARKSIIEQYFETIALISEGIDYRPAWGVEVDLRGMDFTNEAFVALYDVTVAWHDLGKDHIDEELTELSKLKKLAVSPLQARASFLRMMMFFCGKNHPLLESLINTIKSFMAYSVYYIMHESAAMRMAGAANIAWMRGQQMYVPMMKPAQIGELRYIIEAFYNIEYNLIERFVEAYSTVRVMHGQPMSLGAHANHLIINSLTWVDCFNNLRANQQSKPIGSLSDGIIFVRTTAFASVAYTRLGRLYTVPLGGDTWIHWESLDAHIQPLIRAGPEYVLRLDHTMNDTSGEIKAYRINMVGRVGAMASDEVDSDYGAALRARLSKNRVEDLLDFACGATHAFLLKQTGKIEASGTNARGQVALGHAGMAHGYTDLVGVPFIWQIEAGANHTLLIGEHKTHGLRLYACGDNRYGQLGLGLGLGETEEAVTEVRVLTPVKTEGVVSDICCGANHSMVLTETGLYATGDNKSGQLGLGDTLNRSVLTPVNHQGHVIAMSCGAFFTALWTTTGYYVSGGASSSFVRLTIGQQGPPQTIKLPVQPPNKLSPLPRRPDTVTIDLTGEVPVTTEPGYCRYCASLLIATYCYEHKVPRLRYCSQECHDKLHAVIAIKDM